jgi:hypothetical protein
MKEESNFSSDGKVRNVHLTSIVKFYISVQRMREVISQVAI